MDDSFVNLGEEVILTLLWQSGASESVTVCFVISLSICYWLLKCRVLRVVCVCERERVTAQRRVCVWERERETGSHHSGVSFLNRGLFANTYKLHHCVCHATLFPSLAWTDGKTKDIINCLYFYFESWSSRLWKGVLHFWRVLVVFGQSQCKGSAVQSEQTAVVGKRDFVENEAFERGRA